MKRLFLGLIAIILLSSVVYSADEASTKTVDKEK